MRDRLRTSLSSGYSSPEETSGSPPPPPSIAVASPNGGESWVGNSVHAIQWTSTGVVNVKIEYSLDNGTSWTTITASTPSGPGTFNWTVPNTATVQGLVRITDTLNPLVTDTSNANFTILQQTLTLTSPNGGESWVGNSVHAVTWTSANIANVKLEYSLDNGGTWVTITASTPAAGGTFNWTVPNLATVQGLVRVSDVLNPALNDISNANFTILQQSIAVTSPNGGESWVGNSVHAVTWTSANIANVKIEYSLNNGSTWNTITASTPAAGGTFNWTVPNSATTQGLVRISDVLNPALNDISNANFTISVQTIQVTFPNGGETVFFGLAANITWTSANVANVKIEGSTDNGSSWVTIVGSTPAAAGSFSYDWVGMGTSTQCLVRISDVLNAGLNDVSNSDFTIAQFDPSSLSDLVGWYQGQAEIDIFGIADGGAVNTMHDLSGNGNDMPALNRPAIVTTTPAVPPSSGKAVYDFFPSGAAKDGYDETSDVLFGATGATAICFAINNSGADANNFMWDLHDRSGLKCVTETSQWGRLADGKVIDGSFYSVQPAAWTPGSSLVAWNMRSVRVGSNIYNVFLGFTATPSQTDNTGVFINNTGLRFAENCGGSGTFKGQIAELIIYKRALTDAELLAVLNYLDQQYN